MNDWFKCVLCNQHMRDTEVEQHMIGQSHIDLVISDRSGINRYIFRTTVPVQAELNAAPIEAPTSPDDVVQKYNSALEDEVRYNNSNDSNDNASELSDEQEKDEMSADDAQKAADDHAMREWFIKATALGGKAVPSQEYDDTVGLRDEAAEALERAQKREIDNLFKDKDDPIPREKKDDDIDDALLDIAILDSIHDFESDLQESLDKEQIRIMENYNSIMQQKQFELAKTENVQERCDLSPFELSLSDFTISENESSDESDDEL
jgi:hypothetical protein